jgi:hypothetical protein
LHAPAGSCMGGFRTPAHTQTLGPASRHPKTFTHFQSLRARVEWKLRRNSEGTPRAYYHCR